MNCSIKINLGGANKYRSFNDCQSHFLSQDQFLFAGPNVQSIYAIMGAKVRLKFATGLK